MIILLCYAIWFDMPCVIYCILSWSSCGLHSSCWCVGCPLHLLFLLLWSFASSSFLQGPSPSANHCTSSFLQISPIDASTIFSAPNNVHSFPIISQPCLQLVCQFWELLELIWSESKLPLLSLKCPKQFIQSLHKSRSPRIFLSPSHTSPLPLCIYFLFFRCEEKKEEGSDLPAAPWASQL